MRSVVGGVEDSCGVLDGVYFGGVSCLFECEGGDERKLYGKRLFGLVLILFRDVDSVGGM